MTDRADAVRLAGEGGGRLLVVAMHRLQLLRVDPDGVKVHADLAGVADYHTNDMVVDASGRAYVGNFGFRLDQAVKELLVPACRFCLIFLRASVTSTSSSALT